MSILTNIQYCLLDAARMKHMILIALEYSSQNSSLYRGRSEEALSEFAPYLFEVKPESGLAEFIPSKGWGKSWGVLINSTATFEMLYKHFRKFLLVMTEGDKQLYFRFYDPRVLRIFLPTCNSNQLIEFFGPVKQFIMEDENPEFVLRFWLENGLLKQDKIEASAFFAEKNANQNSPLVSNIRSKNENPSKSNPWLD